MSDDDIPKFSLSPGDIVYLCVCVCVGGGGGAGGGWYALFAHAQFSGNSWIPSHNIILSIIVLSLLRSKVGRGLIKLLLQGYR